jgi:uncharacterized protein
MLIDSGQASRRRLIIGGLAALGGAGLCPAVAPDAYERGILRSREQAGEHFKSESGPLTLVARFSPRDGKSTLGNDPGCSLVVPDTNAPPKIGEVTVKEGRAILRFAPGVRAVAGGKQVSSVETNSKSSQMARASVGSIRLGLYFIRGEQLQISVGDPNWTLRKEAQPLSWFPVNRKLRIVADWVPYDKPKTVHVPDNDGSSRERSIPAFVRFVVNGQKLSMIAVLRPDNPKPFFVFGDATNGHETYGAGRFLDADPPRNGKITLDFNEAHNPLCAYNHEFLCPIAPKENRLAVAIRAGEQKYRGNHQS